MTESHSLSAQGSVEIVDGGGMTSFEAENFEIGIPWLIVGQAGKQIIATHLAVTGMFSHMCCFLSSSLVLILKFPIAPETGTSSEFQIGDHNDC